jgi:DNA-binding XRE family transcriptional regulator
VPILWKRHLHEPISGHIRNRKLAHFALTNGRLFEGETTLSAQLESRRLRRSLAKWLSRHHFVFALLNPKVPNLWSGLQRGGRPVAIRYKCYYICTYSQNIEVRVNMFAFNMTSPAEVIGRLAERMKRRRIDVGLTQRDVAARAGVSYGSLRLFEGTGKISLEALVKIAFVLEAEAEFEHLFPLRPPKTIDDIVGRPVRQRVRRK